ncbi:hypothetical protein, variant [Podila verticillata NRRL 6337]|nr:hypothetical protein, variant [Podila verticillata NRRL 6337]
MGRMAFGTPTTQSSGATSHASQNTTNAISGDTLSSTGVHLVPTMAQPIALNIEEQDQASTIQMSGSPSAGRQSSRMSGQTPASTRKMPSIFHDKMERIKVAIHQEHLTLPTFLSALFESDDGDVAQWAGQFYSNDGPRRIIEIWGRKLRTRTWDASFVNSAVDVVVERTRRDLRRCKEGVIGEKGLKDRAYRFPYYTVTQANIEDILCPGFLDGYAGRATYLTRFLKGVLDKKNKSGKMKRMNEDMDKSDDRDIEESEVEKDVTVEDERQDRDGAPAHRRHRGPDAVRGCIAAMLLFMTSQHCNAFQTVMGVFLHCMGCPTRVLDVLSSLGLSVSDDQVRLVLGNMTSDAIARVREAVLNNDWFIVYDNINIANRHHHQRINNLDTFDNGTAATVILIPTEEDRKKAKSDMKADLNQQAEQHNKTSRNDECGKNEEKLHAPAIEVFRPEKSTPSAGIFFPTATDRSQFRAACRHHFSSAISRSLCMQSSACVVPIEPIDRLPVHKTVAFPLQTMKIDESTISGNLAVLEHVSNVGLRLARNWFTDRTSIIVAGDQMTVARLLSLKIHRAIDPDPFGCLSWVHPIPQLFHMRMNLCGTIFRTHYGDTNCPGSLADIIGVLRRKHLTKDNMKFKVADELLKLVFEALLFVFWESLHDFGTSAESEVQRVTDSIIDILNGLHSLLQDPTRLLFGRPHTMADINALLFLRDVAVYIELDEAIKDGDLGRIRSVLPTITLMMHGGGNTNYSRELLRFLYGMRHAWTDEWERRVLSSMLVNPKGVVGGWMATDMYQENNNYLLKVIFSAKGPNMSWEYLRDAISTNIRSFQEIARLFEREVGANYHNPAHKNSSAVLDIAKVKELFQDSGILCRGPSRDKRPLPGLVVDLQHEGGGKMAGGAIDKFLETKDEYDDEELEEIESAQATKHAENI